MPALDSVRSTAAVNCTAVLDNATQSPRPACGKLDASAGGTRAVDIEKVLGHGEVALHMFTSWKTWLQDPSDGQCDPRNA